MSSSTGSPPSSCRCSAPKWPPDDGVELKAKRQKLDDALFRVNDVALECATYGMELLSRGALRSHAIGFLVDRNWIQLVYHDRSIILSSKPFDMQQHPLAFIAVLYGLRNLTRNQQGLLPMFTTPFLSSTEAAINASNNPKDGLYQRSTLTLDNGKKLELGHIISRPSYIIGRGGVIVEAKCKEWSNVIVKIIFAAKSCDVETDLIQSAYKSAQNTGAMWVLNHLPFILHAETHEFGEDSAQHKLMQLMQNGEFESDPFVYEERILCITVFEQLHQLSVLNDAKEYASVFCDILQCKLSANVEPH